MNHNNSRLIISVNEARKLLGKSALSMSEEQIEKLIVDLDEIAPLYIQVAQKDPSGYGKIKP